MNNNSSSNKHKHLRDFNKTEKELHQQYFGAKLTSSERIPHSSLWTGTTNKSLKVAYPKIYKEYGELFKEFSEIIDPRAFKSIYDARKANLQAKCNYQVLAEDTETEYIARIDTCYYKKEKNPNYETELAKIRKMWNCDDEPIPPQYINKAYLYNDFEFDQIITGFISKLESQQKYVDLTINLGQYEGGKFHEWHYTECGEIVNHLYLSIFNDGTAYINGCNCSVYPLEYCNYEYIQYILCEAAKCINNKNINDPRVKTCTVNLDFGCYTPGKKYVRVANIR